MLIYLRLFLIACCEDTDKRENMHSNKAMVILTFIEAMCKEDNKKIAYKIQEFCVSFLNKKKKRIL